MVIRRLLWSVIVAPAADQIHWKAAIISLHYVLKRFLQVLSRKILFDNAQIVVGWLNIDYLRYREQSQKNPVSASAMLTGKFLRIRKVFATSSLLAEEFPNILKMYEYYTKYPDNMQSVRMNWKVSGWSKKCQDELESFQMIKKCPENLKNVSGYSKKSLDDLKMYLDNLESFWMILKMSGLCKKKSGWAKNVPGWSGSLVNAPYGAYLDHGCA